MSQGRSIIDIIQDPAALDAFLRSSAKSSSNNTTGSPQTATNVHLNPSSSADQARPTTADNVTNIGNNIFNQNTTNNTNVQITQNTFNFNANPTVTTVGQHQPPVATGDVSRVVNQTIGPQTNVNVFLNQTVIQQPVVQATTTTGNNQQQMVAININGNQTLIPLATFTKLLQSKTNASQASTTPSTNSPVSQTPQVLQNGSGSIVVQNLTASPSPGTTTVRLVRSNNSIISPTTNTTNLMTLSNGQRLASPFSTKHESGKIIVQVTNNETSQSKSSDKTTNSDLTTQLMQDLQANGSDPEKQIALIDAYLARMHSTEKDREFCTRIIRYRETLSHSVEQARIDGQHRQRLLHQTTTLNTLSSNSTIKREPGPAVDSVPSQSASQQKPNGTTVIQLPLAKQEELLNAVLKKLRHVNLPDLQAHGILPLELTFEQKLQIQKLDMQIAALPADKQQQFARGQRDLVPKYLAKNAASGLNTTTTLTVNPRTKILLGAPPNSITSNPSNNLTNTANSRSLRISSADLIGQQLRKDQTHVLKPDFKSRFLTRGDAIKRLTRYHVLSKPASPIYEPNEDECRQFDDVFETESKRLLTASERISDSISRVAFVADRFNHDAYDKYLFEKMRLDDLREQLEVEKLEYENRKKRALDVQNKPVPVSMNAETTSGLLNCDFPSDSSHHMAPAMSDDAYFDLFKSDSVIDEGNRTNDETLLAINSIVGFGVNELQENPNDIPDSSAYPLDDLDLDNPQQDHNPSRDDETSRAVQNLLGFS